MAPRWQPRQRATQAQSRRRSGVKLAGVWRRDGLRRGYQEDEGASLSRVLTSGANGCDGNGGGEGNGGGGVGLAAAKAFG